MHDDQYLFQDFDCISFTQTCKWKRHFPSEYSKRRPVHRRSGDGEREKNILHNDIHIIYRPEILFIYLYRVSQNYVTPQQKIYIPSLACRQQSQYSKNVIKKDRSGLTLCGVLQQLF